MITSSMVEKHTKKALQEGGELASHLRVRYLEPQFTSYSKITELDFENPKNKAFYSAAYVLMDGEQQQIVTHEKKRIGGFNLYPIGYSHQTLTMNSRVFSGKYRMGFCNFELAASMLDQATLDQLSTLYRLIRADVEKEVFFNDEDSTLVLHRTSWEPPHFHVQDKKKADQICSISYAVKISGDGPGTSIFDFFSDSFPVSEGEHNPITKIYFKGKFIHQVYKQSLDDKNMYFFFVWDGCHFKQELNLNESVYVKRWYNKSI